MALGQWSSQHATESVSVRVSSREDEEVNPSSFQGTTVTRQTTPEEEEVLPVQPRRLLFFPPSIPQILQAAVRDLNVTNRGVIRGQLVSQDLLNPRWDLEVQVPISEEEGDQFLGLLSRDAAERQDDQNE